MDNNLRQEWANRIFRARRNLLKLPRKMNLNMSELFVLGRIYSNTKTGETNIDLTEIGQMISVSKMAISQMFASLEKRGYVVRETNKANRRKITVELTVQGTQVIKEALDQSSKMFDKVLGLFGEEKARQLISLVDELLVISEEIKQEETNDYTSDRATDNLA